MNRSARELQKNELKRLKRLDRAQNCAFYENGPAGPKFSPETHRLSLTPTLPTIHGERRPPPF
jgi:hypothetical protein